MIIKHKLTMDLADHNANAIVHTAQNDRYSRDLEIALLENGEAWVIPQNADVLIRYSKPDGTVGSYDALPDGRCARKIRVYFRNIISIYNIIQQRNCHRRQVENRNVCLFL